MKFKNYVVIAGLLTFGSSIPSISWGQVQQRVTPTAGVALVEGTVQDAATKKAIVSATVIAKNQEGVVRTQQLTGADGRFQLRLDPKQTYQLTIQAVDYDSYDEPLAFTSPKVERLTKPPILLYRTGTKPVSNTTGATSSVVSAPATTSPISEQPAASNATTSNQARVTPPKTLDAKVVYTPPLVVAPVGKTTQLQAIQFVQSKSELLPDAMPALEQLLAFMQSKPTAEIELSGHTDNQGDFDQNLRLSKERVDVVKAYLVQNGIAANRITTRGYGPTRPIASNNSEVTRKLNRRVEMIVVKE
ncbi:OmpA family protein [Spirosoma sp.]|uniref:OmpA family protein n=1 Tax=Spirosoma sp. TaxID=1899569 RepID=UPI003B3A7143